MKQKMIYKTILFLAFLSGPNLARASEHGVGNGGDAVVCFNDTAHTILKNSKSFDLWELTHGGNYNVRLGAANLSVEEKVEIALQRIEKLEPARAADLRERYKKMTTMNMRKFVTDAELAEISDATLTLIPVGNCFIKQAVIQRPGNDPLFAKFLFNKMIYDKMSNDDRAAIELHEIIYWKELDESDVDNSDGVRKYVALVISDALETFSPKLYRALALVYLRGDRPKPEFFNPADYDFIIKQDYTIGYANEFSELINFKNASDTIDKHINNFYFLT